MRRRASVALALLLGLASASTAQQAGPSDTLEIKFLDVGEADAILIQLGRHAVLVDASRGDDIVLYLEEEGVDSLVAAIASHNHEDHIGGMDAVLADRLVRQYLSNGCPPGNTGAQNVRAVLEEKGIDAPPPPWPVIHLGDAKLTVFPSPFRCGEVEENNSSLGVLVERGRFKALMTGDSEEAELGAWLRERKIPDVDVLKAAHHGARNGLIPGWLNATRPEVVVISVGTNGYGHPDPWALRYYGTHRRQVLRTDLDGTVVVSVDQEGNYRVERRGPLSR